MLRGLPLLIAGRSRDERVLKRPERGPLDANAVSQLTNREERTPAVLFAFAYRA